MYFSEQQYIVLSKETHATFEDRITGLKKLGGCMADIRTGESNNQSILRYPTCEPGGCRREAVTFPFTRAVYSRAKATLRILLFCRGFRPRSRSPRETNNPATHKRIETLDGPLINLEISRRAWYSEGLKFGSLGIWIFCFITKNKFLNQSKN